MAHTDAPGWFGKIAGLGDFASRRLPPEWVQACDQWLSAGLQASAHQLGDRWLASYLAAPVWRFAWAPGVAGPAWWFGVVMPSCDSVGRYFPLVLAQSRAQAPADRIALNHLELWWEALAKAALQTLDEGTGVDTLEDALHHVPPWPGAGAGRPMALALPDVPADAGVERWAVDAHCSLADLLRQVATDNLGQRLAGHSLWWPLGPAGQPGHCSLVRGLPPAAAFVDLFSGRW